MNYKTFCKITLSLKKISEDLDKFNSLGLNLFELPFIDNMYSIVDNLIGEIYTDKGVDWFNWFVYENNFGHNGLTAKDENGNFICHSIESTWKFLRQYEKSNKNKKCTKSY